MQGAIKIFGLWKKREVVNGWLCGEEDELSFI